MDRNMDCGAHLVRQTALHWECESVMAPMLLLETSRMYFARTPERKRGAGVLHAALRSAYSPGDMFNCNKHASPSIVTESFSCTSAIPPPAAASGATCPTTIPCVPPENRPSVIRPTESPRPAPISADVGASISRIPGPPFGPS